LGGAETAATVPSGLLSVRLEQAFQLLRLLARES
jgi:hypothetical protein